MRNDIRKTIILLMLCLMAVTIVVTAQSTQTSTQTQTTTKPPTQQVQNLNTFAYNFVTFASTYDQLLAKFKAAGYNTDNKELLSQNGKYYIVAEKKLQFMTEKLYLFFDYQKTLIYYQVSFSSADVYSRKPLEILYIELIKKFAAKYGDSDSPDWGYHKQTTDTEVGVFQIQPFKNEVDIFAKNVPAFAKYADAYIAETDKPMTTEVTTILTNF